jgi:TPP-dependent pyruvate/acetoin dehydrogenase alpha subunit
MAPTSWRSSPPLPGPFDGRPGALPPDRWKWRRQENDPIGIYQRFLIEQKIASEEELDDIDKRAEAEVNEAIQFAESSPEPPAEALFENIYVEE